MAVDVGIGVWVAVGDELGVCVSVAVGSDVRVGKAVAKGKVGKGVKVGKSKSNRAVGVACVPKVGILFGLGATVEGARQENKPNGTAQMQHKANRDRKANRILPVCPCWL